MQLSIDFSAARETGRAAADACLARAEREASFDTVGAADFILAELHINGPKSGELLTDAAKRAGFVPTDDRAFGSVYASMVRRNLIRCVGYCNRLKGNSCAGGRIWAIVL